METKKDHSTWDHSTSTGHTEYKVETLNRWEAILVCTICGKRVVEKAPPPPERGKHNVQ